MENDKHSYTIGVVARRTNIHPETLRIWERRYQLVVPDRNDTGRRLYSEDDIQKLSLVKQLTDIGHPVGGLADLSIPSLRSRLATAEASAPPAKTPVKTPQKCRVLFIGESLGLRMKRETHATDRIEIVACLRTKDELAATATTVRAEVLVLESSTVNDESLTIIRRQLTQSRCAGAVVVFSFGTRAAVTQLENAGILCMKAPVTAAEVHRACLSLQPALPTSLPLPVANATNLPVAGPRRFDAQQLAQLASISDTIACECPNHLAELVSSLTAFEQYSSECISRDAKDAALHAELYRCTGLARSLLEDCLTRVIEMEGITI